MSCLDLCLVVSCQKFSLDSGKGNRSEDVCYTLDKKAASPCLGLLGNPHKVSPWGRNSSLLSLGEQQVQEVQRYPMNICVHTTLKLWNQTLWQELSSVSRHTMQWVCRDIPELAHYSNLFLLIPQWVFMIMHSKITGFSFHHAVVTSLTCHCSKTTESHLLFCFRTDTFDEI